MTSQRSDDVAPAHSISLTSGGSSFGEYFERALFERLPAAVRGRADLINWRLIRIPGGRQRSSAAVGGGAVAAPDRLGLRERRYALRALFPRARAPARRAHGRRRARLQIVHNREHANVSWIMGENLRRVPYQDTLTVGKGVLGAYPNMFFVVGQGETEIFSKMARRVASDADYQRLVDRFGVRRSSSRFWAVYDKVNALAVEMQPIARGTLDLTRYELDTR